MKEASLRPYREYHARRERERWDEKEKLRQRVLEEAREAIRRSAPRFPAIRAVYLFGSILQPGRFHSGSDVDVAIDSDSIAVETPFWETLEDALERNVDLRPRIGAIVQAVEGCGELCYERKVPGPGTEHPAGSGDDRKALSGSRLYRSQIERFLEFLRGMESP